VGQNKCLYTPLAEADPEVQAIVEKETWRQFSGLELIASEVSWAHLERGSVDESGGGGLHCFVSARLAQRDWTVESAPLP
jgi:hypothetical protein